MIAPTNILLIDDNEDDRMLFRRCLKKSTARNFVVTEAATGEDGLIEFNRQAFACVLLDYSLPGRDGIEILKRIRATHSFAPVVMLTGLGNEKVAVSAMREGAQDYLAKSTITAETLERMIDGAIEHCEMQSHIAEQRETLEIFSRAMAHDLKEPLRTMQSMLKAIQEEATFPNETQGYFSSVQRCAVRMTALIDTVRHYVTLDVARSTVRVVCDPRELVEDSIDNIGQLIRERQAVISFDALPAILLNRTQAVQVLQNLLSNAIRHCEDTPRIAITAVETPAFWQLHVSDNGPGVSDEESKKLFKPFSRFSRLDNEGLGLGLAICKKLMDLHRGRIWCEPPSGRGATFVVGFPKVVEIEKNNFPDVMAGSFMLDPHNPFVSQPAS
ncbi:MAG: putative two-component sensor histidine kinase/response regulator hybrid protein [Bradyrhizobium sp.]|nr:putative two-component sensor histidine kinase/response regulator hybrid protein [Bradyrhizobium sp.]